MIIVLKCLQLSNMVTMILKKTLNAAVSGGHYFQPAS